MPESEAALKEALTLSSTALSAKQVEDDNHPLKKIALDNMDGCPVWVISYNHDGRWGIVASKNQAVLFLTSEGIEEKFWFDGRYIFAYRKEIRDYSKLLEKSGIVDDD